MISPIHESISPRLTSDASEITVKFVGKAVILDDMSWRRQFPGCLPVWGRCRFTFDPSTSDYDWLVAYDELPPSGETLACPRENTLLVITEPASIKVYGRAYTQQFGHVLTSQEPWALHHGSRILHHSALRWYYGLPLGDPQAAPRTYDQIKAGPYAEKDLVISTVCSNKAMRLTLHHLRLGFTQKLKAALPELDVFGRGVLEISDKADAMDRYKYHLAIENYIAPHHITEKLTDAYLAGALPLYYGAPNVADYFPRDSFIPIDIRKTDEAIDRIKQAIADDEYTKRKDAIEQARQAALDEQNLFAVLAREIDRLDTGERGCDGRLENRKVIRKRSSIDAVRYFFDRYSVKSRAWRGSRLSRGHPINAGV